MQRPTKKHWDAAKAYAKSTGLKLSGGIISEIVLRKRALKDYIRVICVNKEDTHAVFHEIGPDKASCNCGRCRTAWFNFGLRA